MPKVQEKVEPPWFGSFTPYDPNAPVLVPVPVEGLTPMAPLEGELLPAEAPGAVAAVPNTYPAGITYDSFLYSLIATGISGMGDTVITSVSDGQALVWNNSLGKWVNGAPTTGAYLPLVGGTLTGTPGTLVVNAPVGATGAILTAQVNNSRRLLISADADHILELADSSTTGPTATLRISHKSTAGTPNVGFGSALQFWGEDDSGSAGNRTPVEYATIRTEASSTAAGAVSSDLVVMNKVGGTSTEGLRFKGSDGRAIFAGAVQSPSHHVGDLTTHPATMHVSRASGAADPGVVTYLRVKAVADTAMVTAPVDVDFDLNAVHQLTTGARALVTALRIIGPTYAAVAASTLDEAATVFINGQPIPGTNATITDRYALYVNGPTRFEAGGLGYVWKLPQADTPVGAAVGRIPVNINGTIRYVPYHAA
jgi:hypothetical protein